MKPFLRQSGADGGVTWQERRGIRMLAAALADAHAPMPRDAAPFARSGCARALEASGLPEAIDPFANARSGGM